MASKSGRKKDYPCIRCDQHVKKTDKAVQCALCDLWVHKACENMSDETFTVLDTQNRETGQCFWSCKSCKSYAMKFDKRMRDVEKRVRKLEEETIPEMQTDLTTAKNDIKDLKTTTLKLESSINESAPSGEVTAAVFEELRERESRRCNLLIHNLIEPGTDIDDKDERIAKDKENVKELLGVIGIELDINESTRFAKRLGPANENSPRPLLVGFTEDQMCKSILDKSPDLSEQDEPWSNIKIIRDLTKMQRKEEGKLRAEVEKRNAELTEEESENWTWKVVGRRGERKIAKVSLNAEEETGQGTRGRGRGRDRRVNRGPTRRTTSQ